MAFRPLTLLAASSALILLGGCAAAPTPAPVAAVPAPASTPVAVVEASAPRAELGAFGFDATGVDASVRPGDDFFAYASGAWVKATPIPDDKAAWGMFNRLQDLSRERTRTILEEAKARPDSRVGAAYRSYLDAATVEAKGLTPIRPWLDRVRAAKTFADIQRLSADADMMGVSTLFGTYIGQDDKNPDAYIFNLSQGGIGLPERDYYLSANPRFAKIRADYEVYLADMLTLAGEAEGAARAKAVMAFETDVAKAHWDKEDSSDATKTYNKTTLAALTKAAPGFDFVAFARATGITTDDVIVAQPSAVAAIARLAAKAPVGVHRDRMIVRSLSSFANILPDAVARRNFAFYGTSLRGVPKMEDRWKRAVDYTTGTLGEEVGKDYVARFYPPATKAKMDALVRDVLAAMDRRIGAVDWMSAPTKARARAKLSGFTTKIGYPERWRDYAGLEMRADDLFGNTVRSRRFEHADDIARLGAPIRRWEWGMTPMTVNAYANFSMNEIVFPAAILQPPFFDPNADPAVNYGAIGAVIGHEISHHFDDQGAKYDEKGRLSDWWTKADVAAFEKAAERLVAQYDAYEPLPGQKVNGRFTLGENIGDLAGVSVAYDAYKASLGGKPAPVIDGLTGDQRFFLGYAQVWRQSIRDQALSSQLATDSHSPARQRVAVVRNIDAWYDAFGVKPGDTLYLPPEQRVRVW